MSVVVRCQDCATVCRMAAQWRVRDDGTEWFYCDEHVPWRDVGVQVSRFAQVPLSVYPKEAENG